MTAPASIRPPPRDPALPGNPCWIPPHSDPPCAQGAPIASIRQRSPKPRTRAAPPGHASGHARARECGSMRVMTAPMLATGRGLRPWRKFQIQALRRFPSPVSRGNRPTEVEDPTQEIWPISEPGSGQIPSGQPRATTHWGLTRGGRLRGVVYTSDRRGVQGHLASFDARTASSALWDAQNTLRRIALCWLHRFLQDPCRGWRFRAEEGHSLAWLLTSLGVRSRWCPSGVVKNARHSLLSEVCSHCSRPVQHEVWRESEQSA